jgi:PKD repeat protein
LGLGIHAKYIWDFGDGIRYEDTRGVAIHVFEEPGRYEVGLKAIGPDGGQSQHHLWLNIMESH